MKKGLTLIEMVGVVIVLGIIALIAVAAIDRNMRQNREELYAFQIKSIEEGAKNYATRYANLMPTSEGDTFPINLGALKEGGFVKPDIENPLTRNPFPDCLQVIIRRRNGQLEYTVSENTIDC